jgi:hypothetical protein
VHPLAHRPRSASPVGTSDDALQRALTIAGLALCTAGPPERRAAHRESRATVSELVQSGHDAIEVIYLPRDTVWLEVAGGAGDAEAEDDFAAACHGAFEAHGAVAAASGEALAGIQSDRVDRSLHLFGQIGILTADDATEPVDGADGLDDLIDDSQLHGRLLG